MLIHKDALAVSEVTTPEQSRYFLNGALFDKDGRAVATNGHVLIRFTGNPLPPADFPKMDGLDVAAAVDVIVSGNDLKATRAAMASRTSIPALDYFVLVPKGDKVILAATDLEHQFELRARKIDGAFPSYEKVLDVKSPLRAQVILSPDVLEVVARVARKLGVQGIHLELHGDGENINDQVLFHGQGTNGVLDGALMPMRSPR